ncbi:MAG: ABC transporter permease [Acidobacteria bacterium]|nr:ABC transporter permease [Acidobacteriota bacterium]
MRVGKLRDLWSRVRRSVRDEPRDQDFVTEMEDHVGLLAERYRRQGMTAKDAELAARRQFGNTVLLEEDHRAMLTIRTIDEMRGDLILATRMLRKNPGFAAAAVLTLALAIGANTAIFSLCNAVLFRRLPYTDPDRIVLLWETMNKGTRITVAPANFVDWRNASQSFSEMAAVNPSSGFTLWSQDEPLRLSGAGVSANFFSVLGIRFALGRGFLPEEDLPENSRVAILSHRVWQERFGADAGVAGKTIRLNDGMYTIVGVLPPDFQFATNPADFEARSQNDIWVPLALDLGKLKRGTHPLRVVARLKPGVELHQAQAELNVLGANLARAYPSDNKEKGIAAVPIAEQVTENVRVALQALLSAVGLVLLIACANVANLLLSRAAARQREMAVRVALGASGRRLAQQLLTESMLLAALGAVTGFGLAFAAIRFVTPLLPAELSRAAGIAVDARMLVFTAAISVVTGVLFGLGPLLGIKRVNPGESLKQTNRVVSGGQSVLRSALTVSQIVIATILLIGAGLMAKSFWTLIHVPAGFRTQNIVTARLSLPKSRYPDNRRIAAFERQVLDTLRARPGIQSAGFATYLPLSGSDNGWAFFIEGQPPLPVGVFHFAKYRPASEGYFETLGIPLLRGRLFTPADVADSPWVVVINDSMARRYWGSKNPVGERLRFGGPTWRTVIGVVGDVRHEGLDGEPRAEMYMPVDQAANLEAGPTIVVRTGLDATASAAVVREAISTIDRHFPVDRIETMDQWLSRSVAPPRFRTMLLMAFSILALLMASIGIYGVMNYLVIQRTREFGIRLSLGATRGDLLRFVIGRAAVLIGLGTCLGLGGSIVLARLIEKLLFRTAPLDGWTFAAVPLVLASVALFASYLPARKATRVDPMVALRYE